jgi:putative hydrolase
MLKIDLHTHSLSSGHALNTVYELAKEAKKRSITILGIADHAPSMEGAPHEGYFWISDKLRELYGVEILLGSEVNIINNRGDLDLTEEYLKKQGIVIACIHAKTPYKKNSLRDNTLAITNAMENPYVKIISHPIRPEFKVDIKQLVESACSTKTLLELNDQLFEREQSNESLLEQYYLLISLCKKYGAPIIIGSDAHIANRIGEDKHVMAVRKQIGLTNNMIINNRERDLRLFLRNKSY